MNSVPLSSCCCREQPNQTNQTTMTNIDIINRITHAIAFDSFSELNAVSNIIDNLLIEEELKNAYRELIETISLAR